VAQGVDPEFKPQYCKKKKAKMGLGVVACACNPSYLGSENQEDQGSKTSWAKT
jgi:hypothetical protein